MRLDDLRADIEPQPQPAARLTGHRPPIRFEDFLQVLRRDRRSGVGDGELKLARIRRYHHAHRLIRRSMRQRIGKQIGQQLLDAPPVAVDAAVDRDLFKHNASRIRIAQFRDDMAQRVGEIIRRSKRHAHTRAKPATGEIKHVVY